MQLSNVWIRYTFKNKEVSSVQGSLYKSVDVDQLNSVIFITKEGVSSHAQSPPNSKGLLTTFLKNNFDKICVYFPQISNIL